MTKFRKFGRHSAHGSSDVHAQNNGLAVGEARAYRKFETTVAKGSLCTARRAASFVRGDDVQVDTLDCFGLVYEWPVGDAAPMAYIEFIDRENELRQSKPATPQPPQRTPLDPWTRSRLSMQFAPPKEEKSESDL